MFEADEIDKTIVHMLSAKEIRRRGLIPLEQTESALQQIDLPKKLYNVIDHRVQLYLDPHGNIVKAKLPKAIRKAGLFSTRMMSLTGYIKARGHMSYSTLQSFFNDIMDLDTSQGYLAKICTRKLSPVLQPAYAKAAGLIRNAPIVGTDETGHKNPAYNSTWTWCLQTPEAVFFYITNSRAPKVLIDILGRVNLSIISANSYFATKFYFIKKGLVFQQRLGRQVRNVAIEISWPSQNMVQEKKSA